MKKKWKLPLFNGESVDSQKFLLSGCEMIGIGRDEAVQITTQAGRSDSTER